MWLFLALVAIPIIEIALFIQIGGLIGLWPTLLIVLLTAMLGSSLIRRQGVGAFLALRSSVADMRDPTGPLFDGAMILLSGALLLTPGFLTDTMGLLLLVPPFRAMLYRAIRRRVSVVAAGVNQPPPQGPGGRTTRGRDDDVIDGEWEIVEPKDRRGPNRGGPSPWREGIDDRRQ